MESDGSIQNTYDNIGASGDGAAKRIVTAFEKAGREVDASTERQAQAAEKVRALFAIPANASIGPEANAQVKAYLANQALQERQAKALLDAIEPLRIAQRAYDMELETANALLRTGRLNEEQHAAAVALATKSYDEARRGLGGLDEGHRGASTSGAILQHVIRSSTDSMAAGLPISMIAGEQLSRLAEAARYAAQESGQTEGAFAKFAAVLGGPWGLALTAAISMAAVFGPKLLGLGEDSEKAAAAHAKHADAATTLTDAIDKLNAVTGQSHKTHEQEVNDAYSAARALYNQEIATRNLTAAKLQAAIADRAATVDRAQAPGQRGDLAGMILPTKDNQVGQLQAMLAANNADLAKAAEGFRGVIVDRLLGKVADAADAAGAATKRYEKTIADLRAQAAKGIIPTSAAFEAAAAQARKLRDDTIANIREESKERSRADRGTAAEAKRIAKEAEEAHKREVDSVLKLAAIGDPAAAATDEFRQRVRDISALLASGEISPDKAAAAGQAAAFAYREGLEQEIDRFRSSHPIMNAKTDDLSVGMDLKGAVAREIADVLPKLKAIDPEMEQLRAYGASFVDDVLSPTNWSNWRDMGKSALKDLETSFIKLAALNPLKNLINGNSALPTLTGAFGSISKLFGGASAGPSMMSSDAISAALAGIGHNASGTDNWTGGATWVAENGPEIINLPRGASVTPAAQTRQMLAANDRGGDTHNHFHLEGAVVTQDLLDQMNAIGRQAAARGAYGGAQLAKADSTKTRRRAMR